MSAKSFDSVKVKDTPYLALWDINDLPKIRKWQDRIRAKLESSVEFSNLLEKSLNDHRNLRIEPQGLQAPRPFGGEL